MLPTPRDKAIVLAVYTHGRLRREQIRRLFFRKPARAGAAAVRLASVQATAARLRRLAEAGYLSRVPTPVLRGSGQYLYSLGRLGAQLLAAEYKISATPTTGNRPLTASFLALNHTLEVADFYIALKESLEQSGGSILTWLGERQAAHRFYYQGRRRMIAPDAYCLWSLPRREGSFFLEWERGQQSLNVIGDKLDGYDAYYARRAHLDHLGEVGLTPRLVFVVPEARQQRHLLGWLTRQVAPGRWRFLPTVLVGVRAAVLGNPIGPTWSASPNGDALNLFA